MTAKVLAIVALLIGLSAATLPAAQDIVAANPNKIKVVFENAEVRVLRVSLNPHEKLDLHETRDLVNVPLSDYTIVHTLKDGKTKEFPRKTGVAQWVPGGERVVEAGDKPVESVLIEIKTPARAKP